VILGAFLGWISPTETSPEDEVAGWKFVLEAPGGHSSESIQEVSPVEKAPRWDVVTNQPVFRPKLTIPSQDRAMDRPYWAQHFSKSRVGGEAIV